MTDTAAIFAQIIAPAGRSAESVGRAIGRAIWAGQLPCAPMVWAGRAQSALSASRAWYGDCLFAIQGELYSLDGDDTGITPAYTGPEWIEVPGFGGPAQVHAPCVGGEYGGATTIRGNGGICCADCGQVLVSAPPPAELHRVPDFSPDTDDDTGGYGGTGFGARD